MSSHDSFYSCDETFEQVIEFLTHHTRIFEVIPELRSLDYISVYTLIKGAVQSGKTRIICALSLYFYAISKMNVFVIVRNFTDDSFQYQRSIQNFLNEYKEFVFHRDASMDMSELEMIIPCICYAGNIQKSKENEYKNTESMMDAFQNNKLNCVSLANADHLSKINHCLDVLVEHEYQNEYIIIIDEVDQLLYSEGSLFKDQLDALIENAKHIFGISATLYEPLVDSRFSTMSTCIMTPPREYKGITNIQFEFIEKYEGRSFQDASLMSFLDVNHSKYVVKDNIYHPFLCLVKTERTIEEQDRLMTVLRQKYSNKYTIITYNGTSIKLYSPFLIGKKIVLSNKKKESKTSTREEHMFNNCPLPFVLQYLKDNGGAKKFERIIIISHGLVGRGINIVSYDFEWHLTHMYYRPSKQSSIETMIQSMRLCGIYMDNIPLTCLIEEKQYESLYKGYQLQEDLFSRVKTDMTNNSLKEFIGKQKIYKEKIPRILWKQFKDQKTNMLEEDEGMSMEDFNFFKCGKKLETRTVQEHSNSETTDNTMDEIEFQRLANDRNGMFKKWGQLSNDSAIARLLREIDPRKIYTQRELSGIWKKYSKESLTCLCVRDIGKSKGYGKIFRKNTNEYQLYPCLVRVFEKYF
jgi:hypothetical protein